uniref:GMP reductase n=1 Tax=Lotharella globosa TaxID=91324 RepID=A0A6U3B9B1_9EUKA|mmetsp:Transcript_8785/g.17134  ORF Transcript_8785/g.17134 Transcript_8785/m.17134 type:complete len:374 (-) Transcript_8785:383-1504(-)
MRIENEIKLAFRDVLIRPRRSTLRSRSEVDLKCSYTFRHASNKWEGIPVIAANMDTTGTFEMCVELAKHKMLVAVHKHYTVEEWQAFIKAHPECLGYVAVSAGTSESDFKKLQQIISTCKVDTICMDIANGYSEHFVACIRRVRKEFPKVLIMAGNVVTGDMTEELILAGADIVKVGIGPGSVCTTRKKAGVGYPQLSAVIECADAAHALGGRVISDGGCTNPGDMAKAFGAGADYVMLGGMFAGHSESGGDLVEIQGRKYKEFYGMSSSTAMKKHHGGVANYRASEGKTIRVPYRGPVRNTVLDMLGGIRSACTYTGAAHLDQLCSRTVFIRVPMQTNEVFSRFELNLGIQGYKTSAEEKAPSEKAEKKSES